MNETFELVRVGRDEPAIRCLLCGSISTHPKDLAIANRYCGRCHLFHDAVGAARAMHAEGATHECEEWRTAKDTCAVCGPLFVRAVKI